MIQLTKGTNVLDINLSDFSGAGQDVVQNGSFDDIGADLVKNGDFAQIGSELVTNGDFSATGTELVTNGDFDATGTEIITDGNFPSGTSAWNAGTGWSIANNKASVDASVTASLSQGSLSVVAGKSYKISGEIEDYVSGELQIEFGGGVPSIVGNVTADGVFTFYGKWESGSTLYLYALSTPKFSVSNISVKELGEDWTATNAVLSFANSQMTVDDSGDAGDDSRGTQIITTEIGKIYNLTFNRISTTTSFYLAVGSNGTGLNYRDIFYNNLGTSTGVYTLQFTATSTTTYIGLITAGTGVSVYSTVFVKEVGLGWNLNIPPWSVVSNGIASDGTSTADANQNLFPTIGKSYKIVYTIDSISSGGYKIGFGDVISSFDTVSGTYTKFITAIADSGYNARLRITPDDSTVGTVSNISIKEVGQDWTVGDGWTVEDDKAVFSGTSDAAIYQAAVTTLNKYYKVSVEVLANEGTAANTILLGTNEINATHLDVGVHTFYGQAFGNTILYFFGRADEDFEITNITVQQLDTNDSWVTFADPDSKSVLKLGQVDLEIDSAAHNCGIYQTGLIQPNKLYIITINMKATAAIFVEIAASLGTSLSAVIGTTKLTTEYKEYSFEYVTPFAVAHDLLIQRFLASGGNQTISIDYVSMNGVDESKWINDPTWNPFATSLVFVPTLTDESTNNSKQFTLFTDIPDGGWDGRSLHGQVIINEYPAEVPASGIINLEQPDFLEGFYSVEIRGYLGTYYRVLGKGMAHLQRALGEDGYNRFESYNDKVTYKAYEE